MAWTRGAREGKPICRGRIADLIRAGLINPPVDVERDNKGRRLVSRIEHDGNVSFDGRTYQSPATSGGHGQGRRHWNAQERSAAPDTNGWTVWRLRTRDGESVELADLRARLGGSGPSANSSREVEAAG